MSKPLIGIIGNTFSLATGPFLALERHYVNDDYVVAVEKAGGVPLVIPVTRELADIGRQIRVCDGLVFTGGHDVHPRFYGDQSRQGLGLVNSRADAFQLAAARFALDEDVPVLGICRGHQILNVACGGTLYQDLSHMAGSYIKHVQNSARYEPAHKVSLAAGSLLHGLFGGELWVNSYHHQLINRLGAGLVAAAAADDGAVEAIEAPQKKFVVGVQWHPEMMVTHSDEMLVLFRRLIDVSSRGAGRE